MSHRFGGVAWLPRSGSTLLCNSLLMTRRTIS